jgi:hypothetical protein
VVQLRTPDLLDGEALLENEDFDFHFESCHQLELAEGAESELEETVPKVLLQ